LEKTRAVEDDSENDAFRQMDRDRRRTPAKDPDHEQTTPPNGVENIQLDHVSALEVRLREQRRSPKPTQISERVINRQRLDQLVKKPLLSSSTLGDCISSINGRLTLPHDPTLQREKSFSGYLRNLIGLLS
jgi:hypothetical protein